MNDETYLAPVSERGKKVLDLIKVDSHAASQLMASLPREEQVSLVSHEALRDPKSAQEVLFLLDDEEAQDVVDKLGDRSLFRIMKSQSSTHIGVLCLVDPERVQSILDLDPELFSTKGITDPQAAYHWLVSFLEEDDEVFSQLLRKIDIKVVASTFQDKILRSWSTTPDDTDKEEETNAFPADFMVKLDRGELKPDDLDVSDEEALDILTRIYVTNEAYFNELVSLMIREDDIKVRTAEEAFERIQEQVGDMSAVTEEAEEMFIPLEE
jgi:predicted nucleotidyltransferase